jgi:2-octaprenyl-6-methoxyphenol hydroxylase
LNEFSLFEHELSHQNIAQEKFLPGGPLAILPLKNSNHSSIVWIAPDQVAQAILALDEKNFTQQLMKKMEDCLGATKIISEKFSYPLIAIEAEKFFHEKMLLIGDAACGVHPIAGQGFNLAIAGINILCELVKNSDQNLISSYNKKAKSQAKKMLVATDILNSLFETKSLSIGLARDFGLCLVNKLPRLKKFFIKSAGGF